MARPRKNAAEVQDILLTPDESAIIPVEEQPYPLPEGWKWVKGSSLLGPQESQKPTGDFFYYIDIDNKKAIDEFIKEQNDTEIEIEFKDLKELLSEVVIDDDVVYGITNNEIVINHFSSDRVQQKIDEYNDKMQAQAIKKGTEYKPLTISGEGLELIEFISLDCTNAEGTWNSDSEIKVEKNNYVTINGEKTKSYWDGKISFNKKPLRMKIRNICGDETIIVIKEQI